MKRIIHVLNTNSYSGAENVAITIINVMKTKKDYDIIYVSLDGQIREVLSENNINFVPIKKMSVTEIRRIIKEYNPDIIHAHDFTASVICAISLKSITTTIISHLHNNSPWIKTLHPYSFIYLITTFRYKSILTVSDSIINEYIFGKLLFNKSKVIGNPIDISKTREKSKIIDMNKTKYDIIFLGRLSKSKNPLKFIEIISDVSKVLPDVRVAMIGNGELYEECNRYIVRKNLGKNIEMLGFIKNPYNILTKAKCLCVTSEWEGYGLVITEALSLGIPVVAPKVGGIPTILNNDCGMLCKENSEFVEEILNLVINKKYFMKKSILALKRAEDLDNINSYIKKIEEEYLNGFIK